MMNTLLEPFQFPFMVDAMVVGIAVGAVCSVLSCYLVLKGWSLMGDAISHAVLPGIVIAYAVRVPLAVGAFASGLLCAVLTGYIKANSRVKEDTVMGVVFTGMFAFGLVIFTKVKSDLHLDHILFGNILGLAPGDLRDTLIVAGGTLAIVLALRRDLLLYCFDSGHARTIGLRTDLLYYLLLSLLAVTIVVSLKAVGIILVVAMLVTPGCIGYLLTDRFQPHAHDRGGECGGLEFFWRVSQLFHQRLDGCVHRAVAGGGVYGRARVCAEARVAPPSSWATGRRARPSGGGCSSRSSSAASRC
jgi:ABC-type Mn2+/Zn2+ transport system permease subunit